MIRRTALLFVASLTWAQTAPRFDVVSIKQSRSETESDSGIRTGDGRLIAVNVTLKRCIASAYAIAPNRVFSGPEWLDTDRFDIIALADQPVNDEKTLTAMLKPVLRERFKLAIHRETRMLDAYVMEAAEGGPKLDKPAGGIASINRRRENLISANATLDQLAEVLSRQTDAPVLNSTGLKGLFHIRLTWSRDPSWDHGTPLFTAIQEQLGLQLRAQKIPAEVVVIDHAEKPTEN
jgi:uncharacterized protein (TIGR03435 family)